MRFLLIVFAGLVVGYYLTNITRDNEALKSVKASAAIVAREGEKVAKDVAPEVGDVLNRLKKTVSELLDK